MGRWPRNQCTKPIHSKGETQVLDGAALGTLMIGLESIRMDADSSDSLACPYPRSRPKSSGVRVRAAKALRFVADRLDSRTPAPLGSPGSAA
jgi:hypothetical protein